MTLPFPSWPYDVNQLVSRRSYGERPERNVASWQPEVGPPSERRRSSVTSSQLQFSGRVTDAEWASLMTFYRTTLRDGALPFCRTQPLTGVTGKFKFTEPPALGGNVGALYREVSYQMRELPSLPGAPVRIGADPYTKLLLHGEGANNSTTVIDSSPIGRAMTCNGANKISTAQRRFGVSSLKGDTASAGGISTPSTPDLNPAGDYTIELWTYLNNVAAGNFSVFNKTNLGPYYIVIINGAYYLFSSSDGANWDIAGFRLIGACVAGVQQCLSVNRRGNDYFLFLDGKLTTTFTSALTPVASANPVRVLGGSDLSMDGYVDEVWFRNGVATYTSNYLPATEAHY